VYYSFSKRDGFYDFPELNKSETIPRNDLGMVGGSVGKRWKISSAIRFQTDLGVEAGSAYDDTLLFDSPLLKKYSFFNVSFNPTIQLPVATTDRVQPFLTLGGGINYTTTKLNTLNLTKDTEVVFQQIYFNAANFSISAIAGFGFDISLSRMWTVSMGYSFRLWQPVRYAINNDFLMTGQQFHETFLSHYFHMSLLLSVKSP
jgi:hypothetical protein